MPLRACKLSTCSTQRTATKSWWVGLGRHPQSLTLKPPPLRNAKTFSGVIHWPSSETNWNVQQSTSVHIHKYIHIFVSVCVHVRIDLNPLQITELLFWLRLILFNHFVNIKLVNYWVLLNPSDINHCPGLRLRLNSATPRLHLKFRKQGNPFCILWPNSRISLLNPLDSHPMDEVWDEVWTELHLGSIRSLESKGVYSINSWLNREISLTPCTLTLALV